MTQHQFLKTRIFFFSPTNRTYMAAEGLTQAWANERLWLDLSRKDLEMSRVLFPPGSVCVVAVPCFGGRVPEFAAEKLSKLQGKGSDAVLLVTYGNEGVGDALTELSDIMAGAGFFVRAAVSAVAQHALCPDVAQGRPNANDMHQLGMFGELIRDVPDLPQNPLELPGTRPYRENVHLGYVPQADFRCNDCGNCPPACPTDAIPDDQPKLTERTKCITCMQCAQVCPARARHLSDIAKARIRRDLNDSGAFDEQKKNTLYIRALGTLQE